MHSWFEDQTRMEFIYKMCDNASNNPFASCKSAVSNPSVNQPYTGASKSVASWRLPH